MSAAFNPIKTVLLAATLVFLPMSALGQDEESAEAEQAEVSVNVGTNKTVREVIEDQEKAQQLIREKESSTAKDASAGVTPLATLLGLVDAFEDKDYRRAGEFLDMRYLPEEMDDWEAADLMRALAVVFSRQNMLDITTVSDSPEGHLKDGLPSYRDIIGTIYLSDREVPIYLQRVPDGQGGKVWKFSNATVKEIPQMWDELGFSPVATWMYENLPDFRFLGMENWQVVATTFFFVIAWPMAVVVTWLMNFMVQRIPNIFPRGIERFFRREMRFFVFILIARTLIDQLGLSLKARIFMESNGVDYVAYTVLLLGFISLVRDYQIRKRQAEGNINVAALIRPMTTMLKVLAVIILGLVWADSAGYNMSTVLAGLGVGSLAVALAAQKTLENLIGAITLYTARPVGPGDFCRFGKVTGTVEEIGLRSTTIRTLDRTQVVIPNSVFASTDIENFSARDRIRFFRNIGLLTDNSNQLRVILAQIRELFHAHPMIVAGTTSVRLDLVEGASAGLRLDAGINTQDYQEFLAVAEDLNLRIIDIVQGNGARFGNTQQVALLREDHAASGEQLAESDALLERWRDEDQLPFPDYREERIAELSDSITYPPRGCGR